MSEIKDLMESYFIKLDQYSHKQYGTPPVVPFITKQKAFYISEPDEEDYVCWRPLLYQHPRKLTMQETNLPFDMKDELNDYYTSWLYLRLAGKKRKALINFFPHPIEDETVELISLHYDYGQYFFPASQVFQIGSAIFRDDDNYNLFYDNITSEVFIHEVDKNTKVHIAKSLVETIQTMTATD